MRRRIARFNPTPDVGDRVERVKLIEFSVIGVSTAEDVDGVVYSGHGDADARWRDGSGCGGDGPGEGVEIEKVEVVVDRDAWCELATEDVYFVVD